MKLRQYCFFLFCAFLTGCAVGPNYKRPTVDLPENYTEKVAKKNSNVKQTPLPKSQQLDAQKSVPAAWWTLFHSEALNELVLASFRNNPGIDVAKSTLQSSLENVYAQRGALYPFIGASFIPSEQQTAKLLTSVLASNNYIYSLYTGQVFVSYTPDVFGGIRRQLESLIATSQAAHFQLQAAYITLASNVVYAAIQEASLREQIITTKQIVRSQARIVSIVKHEVILGNASLASLNMQEAQLATIEATLPPLEIQRSIQRDLIKALAGRFPDDKTVPSFTLSSLHLPAQLPISVPSTLIEHRPDIRASESNMHSANALIGVATANRLPNVTIGFTNAGTAATELGALFQRNTNFWALAGIISQPLFDAGTLKHKQAYAIEIYKQAAAQYRATVINAFQNVADVLNAIRLNAVALSTAQKAEKLARASFDISKQQFRNGSINTPSLLLTEQLYYQAKLNLIQVKSTRLSDTVALFQALGGGWWNKTC